MRHIIIIGPQGAGKGTQARKIAGDFNLQHLSTGDLFRALMEQNSELADEVRRYYDAGDLVPDELTAEVLFAALDEAATSGEISGALFDGYPRNQAQARVLEEQIDGRGESIGAIVYLQVPEAVLMERVMARGRADDSPEALSRRLEIYFTETEPIINYWRDSGFVVDIDGDQTVEEVYTDIHDALTALCRETDG